MRPVSIRQSALRAPLNHVLGTEANVRVLRVVMLSDIPIGAAELARRARLQASGVARVCTRLEDLGVLEAVGRGARNQQYRRSHRFPFYHQLMQLFAEERARAEAVLNDVKTAVRNMNPRAGWIEGSVAVERDAPEDPIVVGILVEPRDVNSIKTALWRQLLEVQRRRDIGIELRVMTLADLKTVDDDRRADLESAVPVSGPPPLELAELAPAKSTKGPPHRTHSELDARSKDVAALVAQRIRRDASLVDDAREYVERRLPSASPGERLELEEWQGILSTMSVPRLCRLLISDDQRAVRLRQSSPFLNVISDSERDALFRTSRKRK